MIKDTKDDEGFNDSARSTYVFLNVLLRFGLATWMENACSAKGVSWTGSRRQSKFTGKVVSSLLGFSLHLSVNHLS